MNSPTPIHTSPLRTVEAAKMLMDWGKWLVAVETAAIGALGFIAKTSDLKLLVGFSGGGLVVALGIAAVVCFVISILNATFLLLFLPALVERIPDGQDAVPTQESIWHVQVPFAPHWQVGQFTTYQTRFFVAGIVLFAAAYIAVGFAAPRGAA